MAIDQTQLIMASALRNVPHVAAFDALLRKRYEALADMLPLLLMDYYDTVDARLLPYLAEEWGLLGDRGWSLAETEEQQRALLKQAYHINRTMGTPGSIRRAAKALGIKGYIRIDEGIGFLYDGEFDYDGTMNYGAGRWATFAVFFDESQNPGLPNDRIEKFRKMIEEYKPARSRLVSIGTYTSE